MPLDWSNHHLRSFDLYTHLKCHSPLSSRSQHWTCNIRHIPQVELESRIADQLLPTSNLHSTKDLSDHYNTNLSAILDQVAPLKLKRSRSVPSKMWFNTELNKERRELRLIKRKWRQTPLSGASLPPVSRKTLQKTHSQRKICILQLPT